MLEHLQRPGPRAPFFQGGDNQPTADLSSHWALRVDILLAQRLLQQAIQPLTDSQTEGSSFADIADQCEPLLQMAEATNDALRGLIRLAYAIRTSARRQHHWGDGDGLSSKIRALASDLHRWVPSLEDAVDLATLFGMPISKRLAFATESLKRLQAEAEAI